MRLIPTKRFLKEANRLPTHYYEKLRTRLALFEQDPFHITLHNHHLSGSLRTYRSINITGDLRLIYEPMEPDTARLITIGTHHALYGS